jgi:hypothetical protein
MKILRLVIVLLLLAACNTPDQNSNQQVGITRKSGIEGTVTIGPTCPVQRLNDPSCDDRPYQGVIHVSGTNKTQVAKFQADSDGKFKLELEPGNYTLEPQTPMNNILPRASNQDVTVVAGAFTPVNIQYDSGIR